MKKHLVNVGTIGHIDHGKPTIHHAISTLLKEPKMNSEHIKHLDQATRELECITHDQMGLGYQCILDCVKKALASIEKARAALSTEAQPEVTGAVARVDDLERGGRVRALALGLSLDAPLYPASAIKGYAQELAKRLVREKLEEVVNMIEHTPSLKDPDDTARLIQNKVRALINT